jgi:hypothetical protein
MRRVEIVEEPSTQRCWVVIDVASRKPILRLHDRDMILKLCQDFEWQILTKDQRQRNEASQGGARSRAQQG